MKHLIAVAALCVIAGPAGAQTTTCNWIGTQWTCQQQPDFSHSNPGVNWNPPVRSSLPQIQAGSDFVNQMFDRKRAQEAAQAESARQLDEWARQQTQRDAEQSAITRKHTVATAIAEGRCAEAKKMALEWGDLDLAQQAVLLCTAAP